MPIVPVVVPVLPSATRPVRDAAASSGAFAFFRFRVLKFTFATVSLRIVGVGGGVLRKFRRRMPLARNVTRSWESAPGRVRVHGIAELTLRPDHMTGTDGGKMVSRPISPLLKMQAKRAGDHDGRTSTDMRPGKPIDGPWSGAISAIGPSGSRQYTKTAGHRAVVKRRDFELRDIPSPRNLAPAIFSEAGRKSPRNPPN